MKLIFEGGEVMVSSEFNKRKEILDRYFCHPRWTYKGDDDWEYEYYKGKRNLQELEYALNIVFDECEMSIIEKRYFKNNDGEIIGGTIVCSFDVAANFNGIYQGSDIGTCYLAFTLVRYGFLYNQSDRLDYLLERLN